MDFIHRILTNRFYFWLWANCTEFGLVCWMFGAVACRFVGSKYCDIVASGLCNSKAIWLCNRVAVFGRGVCPSEKGGSKTAAAIQLSVIRPSKGLFRLYIYVDDDDKLSIFFFSFTSICYVAICYLLYYTLICTVLSTCMTNARIVLWIRIDQRYWCTQFSNIADKCA